MGPWPPALAFGSKRKAAGRDYGVAGLWRWPPGHMLRELRRFFEDYKALEHKQVIVEDLLGPEEAVTIIRDALELYRRLRRGELVKA